MADEGLEPTPDQTVGPFFHYVLTPHAYPVRSLVGNDLTQAGVAGETIRIEGRVLDGDGSLVSDALVEIWQADAAGHYAHPEDRRGTASNAFRGFGRSDTDATGVFRFTTIRPGPVPGPGGGTQAPHIAVTIFARGLLRHLVTRFYFPDEPLNGADPILALVPAERRATLMLRAAGKAHYGIDICLQGDQETVFFDV
ncbi:MAG: protocatechuate 3,4-dioxygenase subunit alpha [Alphaproteobacteria bacterium]|nr:protocatechuate 3,4-dioxygenase subunit alpha [Alphaproteobacteria bacterium]